MLFSVVIPARNRLAFLPDTLASLWRQTFRDYETIVVDDGSTDGTREYLQGLGNRVRVVEQSGRGPGAARNAGAAQAAGTYLAFLDSDDIWFPWTLETFARLIADSRAAVLMARYVDFTNDSDLKAVTETPLRFRRFADYLGSSANAISAGSGTVVIDRAAFLAAGGFTDLPINAEDHDLMLRLGEMPGFVEVLEPITLAWRRHAGSIAAQVDRCVAGMTYLIQQERSNRYPGGPARAHERRRIITRHVRPVTLACLREGGVGAALALFRATLGWNLASGHVAYVAALPVLSAWSAVTRRPR